MSNVAVKRSMKLLCYELVKTMASRTFGGQFYIRHIGYSLRMSHKQQIEVQPLVT